MAAVVPAPDENSPEAFASEEGSTARCKASCIVDLLATNGTWRRFRIVVGVSFATGILATVLVLWQFKKDWGMIITMPCAGVMALALWMAVCSPRTDQELSEADFHLLRDLHRLLSALELLFTSLLLSIAVFSVINGDDVEKWLQFFGLMLLRILLGIFVLHGSSKAQEHLEEKTRMEFMILNDLSRWQMIQKDIRGWDISSKILQSLESFAFRTTQVKRYTGDDKEDEKEEEEQEAPDQAASQDTCSICLESFQEGDEVSKTGCEHIFHKVCLETWVDALSKKCSKSTWGQQVLCPMRCKAATVSAVIAEP
eukprot:TRINITY_DN66922_c0_g1_i1.p1 TRINITY_DN66922_c0_g1~~TRINITY_DN66922_c0_g1_i1.p1  ORF type:complete len:322 (-),score=85.21 TRINITY_DN66922_c0_g1_i1:91-1026(-)